MRIRGIVNREIRGYEIRVQAESPCQFTQAFAGHRTAVRKQVDHPDPRPCAKRQLQAARPVNSAQIRVLALPVLPLSETFLHKSLVAGQSVGECQRNKMLVAIWFPDDLTVADF